MTTSQRRPIALLVSALLAGAADAATDCDPAEGLAYLCGPVAAEDMVEIPGTHWAIASALNVGAPARLQVLDLRHRRAQPVEWRSGPTSPARHDPACATPPDPQRWSTDGLALRSGTDGQVMLYVANHGDRQAIEVFDVLVDGPGSEPPPLRWAGCLPLPVGHMANAVHALPDGGLLVASFHDPRDREAWARMARGEDTGAILEWQPARGWRTLARMPGGNGITASADGDTVYASAWAAAKLVVLSRRSGARRDIVLDYLPDNLHMLPDGRLLVAGQRSRVADIAACTGPQCPQLWVVERLDPATGTRHPLLQGSGTTLINYACGARLVGDQFFVTFRGAPRIGILAPP
ncbi:MAG: hypothetical protein RL026_1650 [Pseudomonadota bacterium]|jgi:hypothetical protein